MADRPDPNLTDKETAREWVGKMWGGYKGHDVIKVVKEALDKDNDGDDDKAGLQPEEG